MVETSERITWGLYTTESETITLFQNVSANSGKEDNGNCSLSLNCTNAIEHDHSNSGYSMYPPWVVLFGTIAFFIFAVLGTTGNLISILAMVRCKRLRNATTAFIVNLCVSDMLFSCITMPLTALNFANKAWTYGGTLCRLFAIIKFSNWVVSVSTASAIAVNRYVIIVYPNAYHVIYSPRNTGVIIGCLWILPLLLTLPFFNFWGTLATNTNVGGCSVLNPKGKSSSIIFAVITIVPIFIFTACYLRIYFAVKNSNKNIGKRVEEQTVPQCLIASDLNNQFHKNRIYIEKRNKKVFKILRIALVIFLLFLISTFPVGLLKVFRKEREWPAANVFGYLLLFISNTINPVIYIAMSKEFRVAYKEFFSAVISTCRNINGSLKL